MKRVFLLVVLPPLLLGTAAACRGTPGDSSGSAAPHPPTASSLDDATLSNGIYCASDINNVVVVFRVGHRRNIYR